MGRLGELWGDPFKRDVGMLLSKLQLRWTRRCGGVKIGSGELSDWDKSGAPPVAFQQRRWKIWGGKGKKKNELERIEESIRIQQEYWPLYPFVRKARSAADHRSELSLG